MTSSLVQVVSVAPFDGAGRMLMGLRNKEQAWNLPGGHVEPGETPIRAAVRELLEETGLRPGIGGLEFLTSRDLTGADGKRLRVFSFRTTGVQGTPTGENDPDGECDRWEWVDVGSGLPAEIENNLYNAQDVTLQALGFQAGPVRKFEIPPALDLRLPSLARLTKNEVLVLRKSGESDDRQRAEALFEPLSDGARDVLHQLSERETALAFGNREEAKIIAKTTLSNFERELLLQRTIHSDTPVGDMALTMGLFGGESGMRVESPWTEDQRLYLIRNTTGHLAGGLVSYLAGAIPGWGRPLTDSERATFLQVAGENSGAANRLSAALSKSGDPERARRNFGWDTLTADQLDGWFDNTTVPPPPEYFKHPNLSKDTVDTICSRAETGVGLDVIWANPKADPQRRHEFLKKVLAAGQTPRLSQLSEELPEEVFAPLLADMYTKVKQRPDAVLNNLMKSLILARKPGSNEYRIGELPKDFTDAVSSDRNGTGRGSQDHQFIQMVESIAQRKDTTVELRKRLYSPTLDGSTATYLLKPPAEASGDTKSKFEAWHRELMDSGDLRSGAMALDLGSQEPTPKFLETIREAYRNGRSILDQPVEDFGPKWGKIADVLSESAAGGSRRAMSDLVALADSANPPVRSEHLDPIFNTPSPENLWSGPGNNEFDDLVFAKHKAALLPQVTGQQFFNFLNDQHLGSSKAMSNSNYDATEMVKNATRLHANKLTSQQALSLLDSRQPLVNQAGALSTSLKKEDISNYLARPAGERNLLAAEFLARMSPNFDVGHLQQMLTDSQPSYPGGPPESSLLRSVAMNVGFDLKSPDLIRHIYHHMAASADKSQFRGRLLSATGPFSNPETPVDVLMDAERRLRKEPPKMAALVRSRYGELLRHPKLDLDHFQEMVTNAKIKKLLSPHDIQEAAENIHPDTLFSTRVAVKPGTERFREIRDAILKLDPERGEVQSRHLPPGDWSVGRLPNGNISAKKLQEHIDNLPANEFNVSASTWSGIQRHNVEPSKVFQLNITTKHLQEMKAKGILGVFRRMLDASYHSEHPVEKQTVGWIRFTGDAKRGIFIDEIQSDFGGANGRTYVQKVRSQALAQAQTEQMSPEKTKAYVENAVSRAESQFPEAAEKEIGKIVFGGRPTNQVVHEAFLQHLRDTGHENVPVHMHSVETKAPISLSTPMMMGPASESPAGVIRSVPAHMKETYGEQPRKMGYKPVRYGDIPATSDTETIAGHLDAKPIINGTIVRKSEDDSLRAAFRSKDGEVIVTGTVHDLFALPGGVAADLQDFQDGFVDDDGRFLTRDEAKALQAPPAPLEKKTRSVETQIAMALVKMAVNAKDLGPVQRATNAEAGEATVDATQEEHQHPGHIEAEVREFKSKVIDSPQIVKRAKTRIGESNSTGKVIYDLKSGDEISRFMVKPYHEKIVPRMRAWHHAPVQGWAEMTNQALYHAAGIGHLHQNVHVAQMPLGDPPQQQPTLVVKLRQGVHPIMDSFNGPFTDQQRAQARQIALMDFLSNNLDRHANNLMIDPQNDGLLAIDHSRSFQYKSKSKDAPPRSVEAPLDDSLQNYTEGDGTALRRVLGSTFTDLEAPPELLALEQKARDGQASWGEANAFRQKLEQRHRHDQRHLWTMAWKPTFEWWKQHSQGVVDTFRRRLKLVRDDRFREHMWRNFLARTKVLDEYARDGHENYGMSDWHHFKVPFFRLGSKLHESDEFEHWFTPWSEK